MKKSAPLVLRDQASSLLVSDVRSKLGEIFDTVYYRDQSYIISRKRKTLAWIVSNKLMSAIDQLLTSDAGLAETISILMDSQIKDTIVQSRKESDKGQLISVDEAFS